MPLSALFEFTVFHEYWDYTPSVNFFWFSNKYPELYDFYFKYNDEWVIGKTSEEIIEKYGNFDSHRELSLDGDGYHYYILLDHWSWQYILQIIFEDNIATKVVRREYW